MLIRNWMFLSRNWDTAFLNEVSIDIYLTDIVDNHSEFDSLLIAEDSVEQCSFAATQITCKQQYWNVLIIHIVLF